MQLCSNNQPPALHTDPHQCLVEAGRRPVIRGGVEGRVFTRHHRIRHNHTVPLVHAEAASTFNLRCQVGAGRVGQQASHPLVVLHVASRSVVDSAAATGRTSFPAEGRRRKEGEQYPLFCYCCLLLLLLLSYCL